MTETLLKWRPQFSVGIEEIDEQHKNLVTIINRFITAKQQNREEEVLKETFINLIEYTKIHFADEEAHMEKNNYFRLTEHKRQHQVLLNQLKNILINFKTEQKRSIDDLTNLLKNWLFKHLIDHDQLYGKFLK